MGNWSLHKNKNRLVRNKNSLKFKYLLLKFKNLIIELKLILIPRQLIIYSFEKICFLFPSPAKTFHRYFAPNHNPYPSDFLFGIWWRCHSTFVLSSFVPPISSSYFAHILNHEREKKLTYETFKIYFLFIIYIHSFLQYCKKKRKNWIRFHRDDVNNVLFTSFHNFTSCTLERDLTLRRMTSTLHSHIII